MCRRAGHLLYAYSSVCARLKCLFPSFHVPLPWTFDYRSHNNNYLPTARTEAGVKVFTEVLLMAPG
jgi:hypothetical protein